MKTKALLIALFTMVSAINANAQSLLTDGKTWNCTQRMYEDEAHEHDRPYSITVCGDTVVCGTTCKRLSLVYQDAPENPVYFAALEKNSRIYNVYEDKQAEFLNFSLSVGDTDGYSGRVVAVDEISVRGITRKRITIDRDGHLQYLVEGIGLSDDSYRSKEQNSFYNVLLSVSDNGACIFTAQDFLPTTSSIHPTQNNSFQTGETYNLNGTATNRQIKGSVYIRGGKKYVCK